MQPMLEPALRESNVGPRNRLPARSSIFFVPVSNRAALRPRRATPLRTAGSATSENKQSCVGPPATDNNDIAPDRRLLQPSRVQFNAVHSATPIPPAATRSAPATEQLALFQLVPPPATS
jgi:hypothetical protein